MKAILNGKLYDTEKSDFVFGVSIPQDNFHDDVNEFNVYRTKNGNVFAEHKSAECLINDSMLKTILSRPDCVGIYIKIFGEVEEA